MSRFMNFGTEQSPLRNIVIPCLLRGPFSSSYHEVLRTRGSWSSEDLGGLNLLCCMQSTVGGLVGKALTSSSTQAYNVQAAQNAPAAIDVFAVQV